MSAFSASYKAPINYYDIRAGHCNDYNLSSLPEDEYPLFFFSLLIFLLGPAVTQDLFKGYNLICNDVSVLLPPISGVYVSFLPMYFMYFLTFIGKGTTSALTNYLASSAKGIHRHVEGSGLLAPNEDHSVFVLNINGIRKIKAAVQDKNDILIAIGRVLKNAHSTSITGVLKDFVTEHVQDYKYYKMNVVSFYITACVHNRTPALLNVRFRHFTTLLERQIKVLINKNGDYWPYSAYLSPGLIASFTKLGWHTEYYIMVAIAASKYDEKVAKMKINGIDLTEYKSYSRYVAVATECDKVVNSLYLHRDDSINRNDQSYPSW